MVKVTTLNETGSNLVIKRANADYVGILQELYVVAARWRVARGINLWSEHTFTKEYIENFMQEKEVFVALAGQTGIGCFSIQWNDKPIWQELDNEESGYLHRLVVSRTYSGMRMGHKLLEWAEQYVRREGKRFFRLDCMTENTGLNQYYKEAGFVFQKTVVGEGWSANLYEKQLML